MTFTLHCSPRLYTYHQVSSYLVKCLLRGERGGQEYTFQMTAKFILLLEEAYFPYCKPGERVWLIIRYPKNKHSSCRRRESTYKHITCQEKRILNFFSESSRVVFFQLIRVLTIFNTKSVSWNTCFIWLSKKLHFSYPLTYWLFSVSCHSFSNVCLVLSR